MTSLQKQTKTLILSLATLASVLTANQAKAETWGYARSYSSTPRQSTDCGQRMERRSDRCDFGGYEMSRRGGHNNRHFGNQYAAYGMGGRSGYRHNGGQGGFGMGGHNGRRHGNNGGFGMGGHNGRGHGEMGGHNGRRHGGNGGCGRRSGGRRMGR